MDDLEKEQLAHAKEYLKQVMAGGKSKFMNSFMSMISYGECGEKIDLATGKVAELTPEEIEQVMSHPAWRIDDSEEEKLTSFIEKKQLNKW